MKKKYAIDQLQEAINIVDNRVGCFQEPIIPSDCPTFDEATANYVRERLGLYLNRGYCQNLMNYLNENKNLSKRKCYICNG